MDQRVDQTPGEKVEENTDKPASRQKPWIVRQVPGGWRTLGVGLGLVAVALLVWAIQPTETVRRPGFGGPGGGGPIPVGVAKAALGDMPLVQNALGTVTPLATVTVKPQVSGQLVKINFVEGQVVRAGEVLAEIDQRPYQNALQQAKGQLARDQAQLADAQTTLTRDQGLIAVGAIAEQQLDAQMATVHEDQGVIQTDQAAVANAELNLSYCLIKAPVAGRVGLRQIDLGNLVEAGQATGIVVVTQLQPISVLFSVPEDSIDSISAQLASGAKLPVDAYDRQQTTKLASGTLATIDNEIDTTTGTVKLRALFNNEDRKLFPNQFVNVQLLVNTLHNQTLVPVSATQVGASGSFVYVVNPDDTVSMRPVSLGPADEKNVTVSKGLAVGDLVVVDGAERLRDGARVLLPGQTPPPQGATAGGRRGGGFARGGRGGRGRGQRGQGQAGAPGNPPGAGQAPQANPRAGQ